MKNGGFDDISEEADIERMRFHLELFDAPRERAKMLIRSVRRGYHEDGNAARDRHFAAHPEDRGANIVIFEFYKDEGRADEG